MNKTCNGMPGKCAEEDLVVYLAFTPIILLIYALRLIHRLDENLEIMKNNQTHPLFTLSLTLGYPQFIHPNLGSPSKPLICP